MIRAFLSFSTLVYAFAAYGLVLLVGLAVSGADTGWLTLFVWARNTALFLTVVIIISFGMSVYKAPWRLLWRRYPKLNQWIFPDLNGLWIGETQSNWPLIEAMRRYASSDEQVVVDELEAINLRSDPVAVQIKSHWFGIRLQVKTSAVNGRGRAEDVVASRNVRGRKFEISYIFDQATPDPLPTDQDSHMGAATLEVKASDEVTLEGEYWNRRSWRKGLNAAGLLTLRRVSEKHVADGADLLIEAQRLEAELADR